MNYKKLSLLLMFSGALMIAVSLVWFWVAYAETMDFVGQYGGSDMSAKMVACLYSSPAICQGAGFLSDAPSYSPIVFWIGIIALLAAVVVHFSLTKSVAANTSPKVTAAGEKILGIFPEQKYIRITYILMLTGASGGLLLPPLMVASLAGFILGLLGLFAFKPRLSELDCNHLTAICAVFAVSLVLLLVTRGSFFFLLAGLAQIVLFYIGFNSYRHNRTIGMHNFQDEARLAMKSISMLFDRERT